VIDGIQIQIPRHPLDEAARKLLTLATYLLDSALNEIAPDPDRLAVRKIRTLEAKEAREIVLGLMSEHRAFQRVAAQEGPLTEEEYQAHITPLLESHISNLSDDEIERIFNERFSP
jgi:hypothetical protein